MERQACHGCCYGLRGRTLCCRQGATHSVLSTHELPMRELSMQRACQAAVSPLSLLLEPCVPAPTCRCVPFAARVLQVQRVPVGNITDLRTIEVGRQLGRHSLCHRLVLLEGCLRQCVAVTRRA